VITHTHTVAENCATGVRRGRIDGEHGDLIATPAQFRNQRRGQRGLPCTGGTGDPYRGRSASECMRLSTKESRIVSAPLDE
jgi:hypothetical protein